MIRAIHPIPAFTDNYIWAMCDSDSNSACVVDPGDAAPVLDYLQLNGLQLTDILITHHHPDHTGGLPALIKAFDPRVFGPGHGNTAGINHAVREHDQVALFGCDFAVIEVPGHTLDHIAFFHAGKEDKNPLLFCGDTLFAAGCGRLFEGTPRQMHSSLDKLKQLPERTEIYCTHEYTLANLKFAQAADPANDKLLRRIEAEKNKRKQSRPTLPSSLRLELDTNPFLRCADPSLIASATAQLHKQPESEVEVFAALRSWKDRF